MIDNTITGSKPNIEFYEMAGGERVKVPYDIFEISPGVFSWRELDIRLGSLNYGGLVSELVGINYSDSEMTAIINNYLLDPDDETTKKEFFDMQDCRKRAKEIAKEILSNM